MSEDHVVITSSIRHDGKRTSPFTFYGNQCHSKKLSIISTRHREHRQSQHHQLPLSARPLPVPTAGHDKHRDQEEEDDDDEAFLVNSPNLIKRMANLFTRYKRTMVIQEQVV
ncbi:unnamed protein product [Absidia cylindrospora]